MVLPRVRRAWVPAALASGAVGAITLDAFLLLVPWPRVPSIGLVEHYTFIASVLVGNVAVGAPWAVPLGMLAHLTVATGWAFGYLSLAQRQAQLLQRPFVSGFFFGLIVWIVMVALLLIPIGKFQPPTIQSIDHDMIAHTLFFGIPLAFVAARLTRNV